MGEAIGAVLPLGVGVALSPLPIVAIVLMLSSRRGRVTGPAFLIGWLAGLAVAGTVVLLVAAAADPADDGEPADWVGWLKLALGLLVLLLAVRTWRQRPTGDAEPELPGWMAALDSWSAVRSCGLGAALSALNPKNLMLTVAAGAAIAQTGIGAGEQAVALAVFVVLGTLGVGLPVVLTWVLGERADAMLADLKTWLARNNAAVLTVVLLVIGAKLVGDGIAGLSG